MPLPRLMFNTDGNWMLHYLPGRRPEDITRMLPALVANGVDALSVLVGIDDDPSWRGSPHGAMWGDEVLSWDPDPDVDPDGKPVRKMTAGGYEMNRLEELHQCLEAVIEDGRSLMGIYTESCHRHGIAAYASLRMNDAHTSDEAREWQVRSPLKRERTDLLLGAPAPIPGPGNAQRWNFSWQWDYGRPEVRHRFLGLIDETLERYDFDGVELDWMRQPPFFKAGQIMRHIPTLTDFMRQARALVRKHAGARARPLHLITRVPPSLDHALELGIDTRTWIGEGLADLVVLSSASYCTPAVDIAQAVACAQKSGTPIYTGFDGGTHLASPHEGYHYGQPSLLRAVAHNGYAQGAAGVHLFNYDIKHHRAGPVEKDELNADHLQLLTDLTDPLSLAARDRCYTAADSHLGGNSNYSRGDHLPQVPRDLTVLQRSGNGSGYAVELTVEDNVAEGLASGRIAQVQLRLRLTDHQASMDRLVCRINDRPFPLTGITTLHNDQGQSWLVVADPPVQRGLNRILLGLDGLTTPDPWPTLHQCEIMLLA